MNSKHSKQRAVEAQEIIRDFSNDMNQDLQTFIESMANEHRTIQQAFTNLCFEWIKRCAKMHSEKQFDLRNEYSVKTCAEIVEKVDVGRCPFI
ncbi:MAG: hypothetical protein GF411_00975 [Candidatus Lokiarchaeota archaeon]|nr:hypothetical protein [Candidatus Lokiarchaeota archaeon]